jgi:pimeloyl-ACP methyl ester carboxylesterase
MPLSLAYREYGKGPPIVILHGLFGSAQNWHSMAERLAEYYRVFACDLRNHGGSPWADSMTFPEMADDLEALIDEKSLAPAIVLGHSVGGKTAMLVALKHPDPIDALIVVDIAPVGYEEPFLDYIRAMRNADLSAERRRADVDAALAAAVPDPATRLFLLQNLVEQDGRLEWRINLEAIAANMPHLLGFPDVSALAYEGRALFVSGARSDYIGRRYHGQIYELFPQAEFAVIEDSGHYPHAEQPELFFRRITRFLESAYA